MAEYIPRTTHFSTSATGCRTILIDVPEDARQPHIPNLEVLHSLMEVENLHYVLFPLNQTTDPDEEVTRWTWVRITGNFETRGKKFAQHIFHWPIYKYEGDDMFCKQVFGLVVPLRWTFSCHYWPHPDTGLMWGVEHKYTDGEAKAILRNIVSSGLPDRKRVEQYMRMWNGVRGGYSNGPRP